MRLLKAERYAGYKVSGVEWLGEVPAHWEIKQFKTLAEIKGGRDSSNVEVDKGGYPVFGSGGVFGRASAYLHDKPSVLLGRKGTIDKPLFVTEPFWSVDTMFYTDIKNKVSPKFFYYKCLTIQFGLYQYGSAVPSMASNVLSRILFAVPPIFEQNAIASYLDTKTAQIDQHIDLLKIKVKKYEELKKSLINETVTRGLDKSAPLKESGQEWIGNIPQHWAVKRIKEFSNIVNGATPKSNITENWDGHVPWVTTDDLGKLNGKFIVETKRMLTEIGYASCGTTICPTGSVVISGRAPIGHLGILAIEACTNQGCKTLVIDHKRASNLFIYFSLIAAKSKLEALGRGTTFIELSTKEFSLFSLTFPPLKEQQAISVYLEKKTNQIDIILGLINRQIENFTKLRKTLINDIVTGKIKVVSERLAA